MKQKIIMVAIMALTLAPVFSQRDLWVGGGIGMVIPANLVGSEAIGFKNVASTGWSASMQGQWFYAKRLSLGIDVGYSSFPQNDGFWDVNNYGKATTNYRMISANLHGIYYFSHKEFRPFAGVGFGLNYLINRLDFQSNYTGSTNDASASYRVKSFKPGFGPEAGFLAAINKRTFFYFNSRYHLIPQLEPEVVSLLDEYGYTIGTITHNPHGHQNHLQISIGLLFSVK